MPKRQILQEKGCHKLATGFSGSISGEIGLDFYHAHSSHAIATQKRLLGRIFDLAKARQQPRVIHCREKQENDYDAAYQVMQMFWEKKMLDHPIHRHCFIGTVTQLDEWAEFLPNCMFGIAAKSLHKPAQRAGRSKPRDKLPLATAVPKTGHPCGKGSGKLLLPLPLAQF